MENSEIAITATLLMPDLLCNIVERLADRHYDNGYILEKVHQGWKAIDTSSIEVFASGEINIFSETDPIHIGFDSSFLFTCTKEKGENYILHWSSSLS